MDDVSGKETKMIAAPAMSRQNPSTLPRTLDEEIAAKPRF
jgi:hypothetical protein